MSINLINTLAQPLKSCARFTAYNEQATSLSVNRVILDSGTNLAPKMIFSRSKEDLTENTFLEIAESAILYTGPALIGEKFARKSFSKHLSDDLKPLVTKSAKELLNLNIKGSKSVLPVKAGIAMSALAIPIGQYSVNFFKNLLTLGVFKKSNFNNVVNLDNKGETKAEQDRVRKSAIKNIVGAGIAVVSCFLGGAFLAKNGKNSKLLMKFSETLLAPGTKLFKNNKKAENLLNKYFSIDFASDGKKLSLSKGQLTSCAFIGGAGYLSASKDRGKENFLETLFRFPVVAFYMVTGSDLFEDGFKKLLKKRNLCKDVMKDDLSVIKFDKLPALAEKLAKERGSNVKKEFARLAKQKVMIFGVPFVFSIGVMGFFVAGISNLFTKYRFNNDKKKELASLNTLKLYQSPAFSGFYKNINN